MTPFHTGITPADSRKREWHAASSGSAGTLETRPWREALAGYWTLTKPEVNVLILITTGAGFYLASPAAPFQFLRLLHTLLGTLLVASGTGTLNQYIERRWDALMRRTAKRPLPAGKISPPRALGLGIALSVAGGIYLAVLVNMLASLLAILTLVFYLFLYTPLKRTTTLCTLAGAFPGAAPTLIGCAAASGTLSREAWVLYAIVFLWQFPHFMAIAWIYREDYARAGYLTLPFQNKPERFMAWQTLISSLLLVPVCLGTAFLFPTSLLYLAGVCALSGWFFLPAARLSISRSNAAARRLLTASLFYLPAVFAWMALAKALLQAHAGAV